LRDEDVDALLVMRDVRIAGVITDRDLVAAVADGTDLANAVAADFTTAMAATVELDTELDEAARVLTGAGARHLLVTDGGTPVGVISARELLGAFRP
jgi:CBS domain-containing protein